MILLMSIVLFCSFVFVFVFVFVFFHACCTKGIKIVSFSVDCFFPTSICTSTVCVSYCVSNFNVLLLPSVAGLSAV